MDTAPPQACEASHQAARPAFPESIHEAIRDAIATYTWCGDNGDIDGWLDTFADGGALEIKGRAPCAGRPALLAGLRSGFGEDPQRLARIRAAGRFAHHVSSIRIALDAPDRARAWSYFAVHGRFGLDHWGRYTDTLVPVGARWCFALRRVSVDGAAPHTLFFSKLAP